MESIADNSVTDTSVMCSAQSSKTETAMATVCQAMSEDPGPALWVTKARDDAKQFVRDRMRPSFDQCESIQDLLCNSEVLEFNVCGLPLYFIGAGSPGKLQSKPIRWLWLDEVRNYKPGHLDLVMKRTRAFWNTRRIMVSTAGNENDAVHRAFLAGDQRTLHFRCPKCGHIQPFVIDQLMAAHPETGKAVRFEDVPGAKGEDGVWDFDVLAPSLRYQCAAEACRYLIADEHDTRKAIERGAVFVAMNPKAPRSKRSFHWNAFLPSGVTWRSIAEEYIAAIDAAKAGDMEPLKTFYRETLGLPWSDQLGEIDDFGFLEARRADYDFGDRWPEEIARFISADCQEYGGEHYWYVIRAFGYGGKSRLVTYGKATTLAELDEIRVRHCVPVANSLIDSGYKAGRIYRWCVSTGWKAFKGDPEQHYLHTDAKGKTVRRVWRRSLVDPFFGRKGAGRTRPIPLFNWANDPVKDMLAEMMQGKVGDWTIPRRTARDYMRQVTAEERRQKADTKGRVMTFWKRRRRDNHLFDCECQIVVAARAGGILEAKPSKVLNVPPLMDGKQDRTQGAGNGGDGGRQAPGQDGRGDS